MVVEKSYDSIKNTVLGRENMKSITDPGRCSNAVLRKDTYLRKMQFNYMIRAFIINIVITVVVYVFLPKLIAWFVNVSGSPLSVFVVYEFLVTLMLWISSTIMLVKGFVDRFYGFIYTTKLKYMMWFLSIHALWLLAELYCAVNQEFNHRGIAALLATLVSVTLLTVRFCVRSKAIVKFRIRARGEDDPLDAFDGEKDVSVVFKDGISIVVNLFEELMAIVENNDIMVAKDGIHTVYKLDHISMISIANKIKVVFNGKEWSVL